LLLWAMSPGGWGRAILESAALPELSFFAGSPVSANSLDDSIEDQGAVGGGVHVGSIHVEGLPDGVRSALECESTGAVPERPVLAPTPRPLPPSPVLVPQVPTPTPVPSLVPGPVGAGQATFRLCSADGQAARAIEQLIAGRSFSATLVGLRDGCADLTISVAGAASGTSTAGRQSTNLTVGGSGGAQSIAVRIVSENGTTQASIAPTG
ncbi:MAG: hypothetical protein M3442_10340, partial [Chloroflexota bacterium]|nr:hypothetical protein [Chloroflexota bacterium]